MTRYLPRLITRELAGEGIWDGAGENEARVTQMLWLGWAQTRASQEGSVIPAHRMLMLYPSTEPHLGHAHSDALPRPGRTGVTGPTQGRPQPAQ